MNAGTSSGLLQTTLTCMYPKKTAMLKWRWMKCKLNNFLILLTLSPQISANGHEKYELYYLF